MIKLRRLIYIQLILIIVGCSSHKVNTIDKTIDELNNYSLSFKPSSINLDKSLNDTGKSLVNRLDFSDTSTLSKISNMIDLILLKECLYQFKFADMEYDLMTRESSYSKKLLFGFLVLNGVDTNQVIEKNKNNLGFTTGDVYDLIKKRNYNANTREVNETLNSISKEIERINRRK